MEIKMDWKLKNKELKIRIKIWLLCTFCCINYNLYAQNYLEFVENKGQWNKEINFKGEITNGAIALQKTGYSLLMLYHNADLENRSTHFFMGMHIHMQFKMKPNHSTPGRILHFRSHVYEVKFLNANPNTY
jgi:Cu/Zn superoxide dismutase